MNDIDIAKMFQEKNKDIFKNSLVLEIERNLDTLNQTTDNTATLEMNKICKFLKQYFEEIKKKYNEQDVEEMINEEKNKLRSLVSKEIEEKKNELEKYFNKEMDSSKKIKDDYIDDYHNYIDEITKKTVEKLESEIKKEICEKFTPTILTTYSLKKKSQQERIKSRIDSIFTETLIKKVKEEIKLRDDSLKNMCNESYTRYLNLNEITT